ncbi:MAG: class I SAM-dependent methyltransferase [Paracoccaceae bacterium]
MSEPPPDLVRAQYEAYPYPSRDPADEAARLIEGSPSHPLEIDHHLFAGRRDWSRPFRALVAGGGTGDALVMLAQKLADLGCPAEVTYLDASHAARAIAEARMAVRGLSARFVTADLLEAPALGPFDYVDCCGVLHHLADPEAGFRALADALAPDGGIGLMVYAPHGRSGVYALQAAFGRLFAGDAPETRLRLARPAVAGLDADHPFRRNRLLGDHETSDAGFYDLLLHGRDRPYRVAELEAALAGAGLERVAFVEPARYDPLRYLPEETALHERVARMSEPDRAQLAEDLAGTMKAHRLYAARAGRADKARARPSDPAAVAHLRRVDARALANAVAARGEVPLTTDGVSYALRLPRAAAPLIARIDGRQTLGQIAEALGLDWVAFGAAWAPVHRELTGFSILHYSRGARP